MLLFQYIIPNLTLVKEKAATNPVIMLAAAAFSLEIICAFFIYLVLILFIRKR